VDSLFEGVDLDKPTPRNDERLLMRKRPAFRPGFDLSGQRHGQRIGRHWLQSILGEQYRVHFLKDVYFGSHIDSTGGPAPDWFSSIPRVSMMTPCPRFEAVDKSSTARRWRTPTDTTPTICPSALAALDRHECVQRQSEFSRGRSKSAFFDAASGEGGLDIIPLQLRPPNFLAAGLIV